MSLLVRETELLPINIIAAKPHYDDEIVNAFFEESDFLIDR